MAEFPDLTLSDLESGFDNPSKNYIREQWVSAAERRRELNRVSHVNYLTFPGPSCLDVKLFRDRDLIRIKGTAYDETTLTFCESSPLVFGLIRKELPNAKDINISFEDLIGSGTPGYYNRLLHRKSLFPYDVINLDSQALPFFFRDREYSRPIGSIAKTFEIQREHQYSFTLFVTFPAEEAQMDEGGRNFIDETIKSNLNSGPSDFVDGFIDRYGLDGFKVELYRLYLLLIPKLVIRTGTVAGFEVSCVGRYTYIGTPKMVTRMVSFIFECEFREGPVHQNPPLFGSLQEKYEHELIRLVCEDPVDVNQFIHSDD